MSNTGSFQSCDLAVIGAGAAGLAAAIFGAEAGARTDTAEIVLLDGAKNLGAKILVSGGGRCNVTHETVTARDFFGNRHIIKNVLSAFTADDTVRWFSSMGVELKREETGKLFPVANTARTVLDTLLSRCRNLGVSLRSGHRVTKIDRGAGCEPQFAIHHSLGMLRAKAVVLATGGRSLPRTGSDGFGYELARRFGHHVTATVPGLVPLVLDEGMFHRDLSGLSHDVELKTVVNGKPVDSRTGSLLWTHFGISGPVVMDASRWWTRAYAQGDRADLIGNFLPGKTQEETRLWLVDQATMHPRWSVSRILANIIPRRFAEVFCLYIGRDPDQAVAQLTQRNRDGLLEGLTRFRFPVKGDRGWNYAEVTAGGVPLDEINYRTMESRLAAGLYVVGEILDCDGRIGGFNFQWAWATGYLAGRAAASRCF